jgi:hypothetical protein
VLDRARSHRFEDEDEDDDEDDDEEEHKYEEWEPCEESYQS